MKTRRFLTGVVAASGALAASAFAQTPPPVEAPVDLSAIVREARAREQVRPGDSRDKLQSVLGAPSRQLTANIWIYWNYSTGRPADAANRYDTLIVFFVDDRVARLRFVARASAQILVARLSPAKPPAQDGM